MVGLNCHGLNNRRNYIVSYVRVVYMCYWPWDYKDLP